MSNNLLRLRVDYERQSIHCLQFMANRRQYKKKTLRRALRASQRDSRDNHLALPEEEIRRLVMRSTTGYTIEPFVRQMVRVMDNLKAGKIVRVAASTGSKRDESRAKLISAISSSAREGNTLAAHETAFLAVLYAYENSLDHLRAFMRYLDGLSESPARGKRASSKLRQERTLHS